MHDSLHSLMYIMLCKLRHYWILFIAIDTPRFIHNAINWEQQSVLNWFHGKSWQKGVGNYSKFDYFDCTKTDFFYLCVVC